MVVTDQLTSTEFYNMRTIGGGVLSLAFPTPHSKQDMHFRKGFYSNSLQEQPQKLQTPYSTNIHRIILTYTSKSIDPQ